MWIYGPVAFFQSCEVHEVIGCPFRHLMIQKGARERPLCVLEVP